MLILAASNGHNLVLARRVSSIAAEQGHGVELIDLVALGLPLYTPAAEAVGPGANLDRLATELRLHQRLWIRAPEYNGSLPPSLSSALAWLSRTTSDFRSLFNGLPVALSSHSGGSGQKALSAMRLQFSHLGSTVLGRELSCSDERAANPESIAAMLVELHRLPTPG